MESSTYEFTDVNERALPEKSLHPGRLFDTPRVGTCLGGRCPMQEGRAQPHIPASAAPAPAETGRDRRRQILKNWLAAIFLEVCDVTRSLIRPPAKSRIPARVFVGSR